MLAESWGVFEEGEAASASGTGAPWSALPSYEQGRKEDVMQPSVWAGAYPALGITA